MMLTNEIEHYICNSGIILKLDKPKKKYMTSVTNHELLLV
jgi:hypothetical protein